MPMIHRVACRRAMQQYVHDDISSQYEGSHWKLAQLITCAGRSQVPDLETIHSRCTHTVWPGAIKFHSVTAAESQPTWNARKSRKRYLFLRDLVLQLSNCIAVLSLMFDTCHVSSLCHFYCVAVALNRWKANRPTGMPLWYVTNKTTANMLFWWMYVTKQYKIPKQAGKYV